MEMSVETAYQRSLETLLDWIHSKINMSKTQVFFRTYAPIHFRYMTLLIHSLSAVLLLIFLTWYFSLIWFLETTHKKFLRFIHDVIDVQDVILSSHATNCCVTEVVTGEMVVAVTWKSFQTWAHCRVHQTTVSRYFMMCY